MSAHAPPQALVDVSEAARILNVTDRTVHTITKLKKLASIRVGRCLRYSIDDLNKYIDSQRTMTASTEGV